jgi:hypothetical protein
MSRQIYASRDTGGGPSERRTALLPHLPELAVTRLDGLKRNGKISSIRGGQRCLLFRLQIEGDHQQLGCGVRRRSTGDSG